MSKLLSANFLRLRKSKVFWLGMVIMWMFGVIVMLSEYRLCAPYMSEAEYMLEFYYYAPAFMIGIFVSVFVSLFTGAEYSDGGLRNKLIVGHTRRSVYFANLITNCIAGVLILVVGFVGGFTGIPLFGAWKTGLASVLSYHAIAILMTVALCAIFTMVSMLCPNRAVSVVICILLAFGIIFLGDMLYLALSEPEVYNGMVITAEGGPEIRELPNPAYVSGTKRLIYEVLVDLVPAGQGFVLNDLGVSRPVRMMLSSVLITIVTTLCGVLCFKKKNIK